MKDKAKDYMQFSKEMWFNSPFLHLPTNILNSILNDITVNVSDFTTINRHEDYSYFQLILFDFH